MDKHLNQEILSDHLNELQFGGKLQKLAYQNGKRLYELGRCHLLSSTPNEYRFQVDDDYQDFYVNLKFADQQLETDCNCGTTNTCAHIYACLQQTQQELSRSFLLNSKDGLQYSREGMIKRVTEERRKRAASENYQIQFAENIHGVHLLTTSQNKKYELSFYDFEKNLGYCSCPDYQTNKLETCKHLIYAFDKFEEEMGHNELPQQTYPFLEIFRHPLHDYQISWFYPQEIESELEHLLNEFFDEKQIWRNEKWPEIHQFVERSKQFKLVKIRPEVNEQIASYFAEESLAKIYAAPGLTKDVLSPKLFPYQIEGALFIASRKGSFLADEIGLGKSAQALSAAILKIKYSDFKKVHIICPEELKPHWQGELNKWIPNSLSHLFEVFGMNEINSSGSCDFLIIDEAQKIDDFESGLVGELSRLQYQHIALITDSKYESSLMKFHAISVLIDKHMLTPLWELSYKHFLFEPNNPEKVIAYHHLDLIGKKLAKYYLRRERADVLNQLPPAQLIDMSVALNSSLKKEQSEEAHQIEKLCKKAHLNKYDWIQLRESLGKIWQLGFFNISTKYRSSQTPKMQELVHFVLHKLNAQPDQQVVIFASGKDVQNQIVRALNQERLNTELLQNDLLVSSDAQFLVTEEIGEGDFSFAHHLVYFNLPRNPAFIEKRIKMQTKDQSGIDLSLFYLLKTVESFESLLFDWQHHKPYFVEQLLAFVFQSQKQKDLSLRLREELAHEMKSLQIPDVSNQLQEVQMDLFGNEMGVSESSNSQSLQKPITQQEGLNSFLKSLVNSWKYFEKLDPHQKNLLQNAQFKVEDHSEEIVIRIRKK